MKLKFENLGIGQSKNPESESRSKQLKKLKADIELAQFQLNKRVEAGNLSVEEKKDAIELQKSIDSQQQRYNAIKGTSGLENFGNNVEAVIQKVAATPVDLLENSMLVRGFTKMTQAVNSFVENYDKRIGEKIAKREQEKKEGKNKKTKQSAPAINQKSQERIEKETGKEEISKIIKVIEVFEHQIDTHIKRAGNNADKPTVDNYNRAIKEQIEKVEQVAAMHHIVLDPAVVNRKILTVNTDNVGIPEHVKEVKNEINPIVKSEPIVLPVVVPISKEPIVDPKIISSQSEINDLIKRAENKQKKAAWEDETILAQQAHEKWLKETFVDNPKEFIDNFVIKPLIDFRKKIASPIQAAGLVSQAVLSASPVVQVAPTLKQQHIESSASSGNENKVSPVKKVINYSVLPTNETPKVPPTTNETPKVPPTTNETPKVEKNTKKAENGNEKKSASSIYRELLDKDAPILHNETSENSKNLNQTPQNNIGDPKVDYEKFVKLCEERGTGNLVKQMSTVVPEFDALPEGKKMLILQGMNDQLLTHVNQRAIEHFQKKLEGKPWYSPKKLWANITKNHNIADFRKKELALLAGNGGENSIERLEFLKAHAPSLMEVFGGSGVDGYLDKKGKKVIADFSNRKMLENASPKLKIAAEEYNTIANKLAHLSPSDKKGRIEIEKKLEVARTAYLEGLIEKAQAEGVPNPEFNISTEVKQREILMRTMSMLSADKNTSKKLSNIAKRPALIQAFTDIWAERGAMTATGAAARYAKKILFGTAVAGIAVGSPLMVIAAIGSGALISGALGYWRGKERAKKTLNEKDLLARRGGEQKKEKLSNETRKNLDQLALLQQQYDAKFPRNADYALAPLTPAQETERFALIKEMKRLNDIVAVAKQKEGTNIGMGNVTRHLERLEKLQTELAGSNSQIEKKEILSRMKTIHDFIEAKLQRNEVNFLGKDKNVNQIFLNQNKLFIALFDAQLAMQAEKFEPEIMNIFDLNSPESQRAFGNVANIHKDGTIQDVNFRERLINVGQANASNTEKNRKNFERSQAKMSALYGAAFSTIGYGLAHYAEGHWSIPDSIKNFFHHDSAPQTPSPTWTVGPNGQLQPPTIPLNGGTHNGPFDWDKFLRGGYNHDAQHPTHHPKIHHHARTKINIPKLPTYEPPKPEDVIDDQIKNLKPIDISDLPKPVDPFLHHVPNFDEVSSHQFDPDEMKTIDEMTQSNMAEELKKFFPEGKHAGLLDRDADKFLDRNIGGISNEEKSGLHEYLAEYKKETGDVPHQDETVGEFLKRVEKFHAEQDYLQGKNIPGDTKLDVLEVKHHQRIIDRNLNEDNANWLKKSLDEDLGDKDRLARKVSTWNAKEFLESDQKEKYGDLQSDLRAFIQSNGEGIDINPKMTVHELMEKIAIANPHTIAKGTSLHTMIEHASEVFLTGKNLEIENLEKGLNPEEIAWAEKSYPVGSPQADEIFAKSDFNARVDEHMSHAIERINKYGNNGIDNNFFDQYKNKTLDEFLKNSDNDQNLDYKGLRDVILKFEKLNRGFPVDKNQTVESFIRSGYARNEYAKFIHDNYPGNASPVNNPIDHMPGGSNFKFAEIANSPDATKWMNLSLAEYFKGKEASWDKIYNLKAIDFMRGKYTFAEKDIEAFRGDLVAKGNALGNTWWSGNILNPSYTLPASDANLTVGQLFEKIALHYNEFVKDGKFSDGKPAYIDLFKER